MRATALASIAGLVAPLVAPSTLAAHAGAPLRPHDLPWSREAWPVEWPATLLAVGCAALYARGVRRLWARAGRGRGVRPWRAAAFGGGIAVTILSIDGPLAAMGGALFVAHMVQHVLLMLVAAPLLVLGAPAHALPWGLSPRARRALGHVTRARALRRAWRALTHPGTAWVVHAVAVLAWHVPSLFQRALWSEGAHVLQHVAFFGSALLFWHALGERGHSARLPAGVGVLYLFTTGVWGAALGAFLTLADRPLYLDYAPRARAWGLTALEDQQLAGLIMWVPAGFVYVGAGLALLAAWLRAAERATGRARAARVSAAPAAVVRAATLVAVGLALGACNRAPPVREQALVPGGEPSRAAAEVRRHGCGTCHVIPGIAGANGRVGPSLAAFARNRAIAGDLPNTPDNVVRFIVAPHEVDPATLMPATGIDEAGARDVAAYLYRQR